MTTPAFEVVKANIISLNQEHLNHGSSNLIHYSNSHFISYMIIRHNFGNMDCIMVEVAPVKFTALKDMPIHDYLLLIPSCRRRVNYHFLRYEEASDSRLLFPVPLSNFIVMY